MMKSRVLRVTAVIALAACLSGTAARAAAPKGRSLRSLEQALAPLAARYDLKITATDPPKPAHESIQYHALADGDFPSAEPYVKLFAAEWAKYPPGFVKASRLTTIAFVTDLTVNGQQRAVVPDAPVAVLFLDPTVGGANRTYQRHCIHHDFYHLVEREINGDILFKDPKWAALNDPTFEYGHGGEFARTSDQFGINHPATGFINKYSQSGLEEDKAEIFAASFTPEYRRSIEQWSQRDKVLRAKLEFMRLFVNAYKAEPKSEPDRRAQAFLQLVKRNDMKAAGTLLETHPDLIGAKDYMGWTALHWAAAHGRAEAIKTLLAHKADVKARDKDGWTPLHAAAAAGSEAACKQLLEAGADPAARDARGRTPHDWAERMGNVAAEAVLKAR
jgi:hypothetical protein